MGSHTFLGYKGEGGLISRIGSGIITVPDSKRQSEKPLAKEAIEKKPEPQQDQAEEKP